MGFFPSRRGKLFNLHCQNMKAKRIEQYIEDCFHENSEKYYLNRIQVICSLNFQHDVAFYYLSKDTCTSE